MLEVAFPPDLGPGENLRGRAAGSSWTYLLPDLRARTVMVLGRPTKPGLQTLQRLASKLIVVETPTPRLPALDASVDLLVVADTAPFAASDGSADELSAEIERILARGALAYAQARTGERASASAGPLGPLADARRLIARPACEQLWGLAYQDELRGAAPASDIARIAFLRKALPNPGYRRQIAPKLRRWLGRGSATEPWHELTALVCHDGRAPGAGPPGYVVEAAAAAGITLDEHRWALLDGHAYPTKKILLFLFAPDEDQPDYVVKIAREPRFNARIDNAWQALCRLRDEPVAAGAAPGPSFNGRSGELAFMAETALTGTSLKSALAGGQGLASVRTAAEWLVELGLATASRREPSSSVAGALERLVGRFVDVYRPAPSEAAFLASQLRLLDDARSSVPLVMQHGDPGTWNVVIQRDGRPAFLDWESSWPAGVPLWDLFYLMRSAAVGWPTRRLVGNRIGAFEQHLLRDNALGRLQLEQVERFCSAAQLDRSLVEPLFYGCWMYRSLKQAATLPAGRLKTGHYFRLLRWCISRRNDPGLRALFG